MLSLVEGHSMFPAASDTAVDNFITSEEVSLPRSARRCNKIKYGPRETGQGCHTNYPPYGFQARECMCRCVFPVSPVHGCMTWRISCTKYDCY